MGDVLSGNEGNPEALIKWYEDGADGAINWCSPGDFDDCVKVASPHLDDPQGFCQERHISVCGGPAGSEGHASEGSQAMKTAPKRSRAAILHSFLRATADMVATDDEAAFEPYPWDTCIKDQLKAGSDQESAEKICGAIKAQNSAAAGHVALAATAVAPTQPYQPSAYHADADELVVCPHCTKHNDDDARYCDQCGFNLTSTGYVPRTYSQDPDEIVVCPHCKKHDDTDASYCDQCGFKLAGALGVTTSTPTSATGPAAAGTAATAPAATTAAAAPSEADAAVTQAVTAITQAVDAARAAQAKDPDAADPKDKQVADLIDKLAALASELADAQSADAAETATPAPTPTAPAPATAGAAATASVPFAAEGDTPGNAKGVPGDADDSPPSTGDIAPTVTCQNPNCGHLASAHLDTTTGKNSGECQMKNCTCPGIVPPATPISPPGTSTGTQGSTAGVPAMAKHAETTASATARGGAAFADAATAQASPQLPATNPEPNSELMGPPFTIPIGIIEGEQTDDFRIIQPTALGWREPPLPLMFMDTMTHDPLGFDQNDPAVLVGRIDYIERNPTKPTEIRAGGYFLSTDDAQEAAEKLQGMGRMGISADVIDTQVEESIEEGAEITTLFEVPIMQTLTKGTIAGFTMCVQPAFARTFIVLGDKNFTTPLAPSTAPATAAPSTNGQAPPPPAPGGAVPIEQAEPIAAASVGVWHHAETCEPCEAVTVPAMVAASAPTGMGPLAPPSAWFTDPGFKPDDGRLREYLDPKTLRPTGRYGCPTTITEDGEVFGHLAVWGVCHTSPMYKGRCLLPPRSNSDYAFWYRGTVRTAEGELVDTGPITAGLGHAPLGFSMTAALAHYDDARYGVADVVVGEDEYGIWFHGAVRPTATPEQVHVLRASAISGDWRPVGSRQELVAALAVNSPGFPHVKRHTVKGKQTALVAAGAVLYEAPPPAPPKPLTLEERIARAEAVTATLAPIAQAHLIERVRGIR